MKALICNSTVVLWRIRPKYPDERRLRHNLRNDRKQHASQLHAILTPTELFSSRATPCYSYAGATGNVPARDQTRDGQYKFKGRLIKILLK